jgi:hypothetical protein
MYGGNQAGKRGGNGLNPGTGSVYHASKAIHGLFDWQSCPFAIAYRIESRKLNPGFLVDFSKTS